ncbi:hypothetical protein GEMRC1_013594 [Eukaryota sp. GEM-RC1]
MSHSEPPLKSSRSLDDNDAVTVVMECIGSSSTICSPKHSFIVSSGSCSSIHIVSNRLHFQQSLHILIHIHFLSRLLQTFFEWTSDDLRPPLVKLTNDIHTFFKKVGYVSHRFFTSALLAVKVFFQSNTFPVSPQDLPHLRSFASFFGADLESVFLHVDGMLNVEEFRIYSHSILGLELKLENNNDLEFLAKSSSIFPRLEQIHVSVDSFFSESFFELLKANSKITSIDLSSCEIEYEVLFALTDVLKDSTSITNVVLCGCCIEDEHLLN